MNKKKIIKIIVLIAVICIPIIYSFFYLKSYWDPYGKLNNMKIAIVNLDEGVNDENLGQKFIDGLIEKDVVDIRQVKEEEAQDGLVNEKYFAVITIPSNFTQYLNSASTTDKKVATITYSPNQKMNYLASQIISRVVTAAETELQSQVAEKVVETLADNLQTVPDKLSEIEDGVDQLYDGSEKLSNGLKQINNGVAELNRNYTEFDNGVNSAYNGSQTLSSGIAQANSGVGSLNAGSSQLDSAIAQINTGATTLSQRAGEGITNLTNGINQLNSGTAQLAGGTAALVAGTSAESQLANGATQVANGAQAIVQATAGDSALGSGASQVANGAQALAQATSSGSQLAQGASGVSNGIASYVATVNGLVDNLVQAGVVDGGTQAALQASGSSLVAGAGAVSNGIGTLNASASALSNGATAVSNGIGTLNANAVALSNGAIAVSNGIGTLNASAVSLNNGAQAVNAGASQLASQETTQSLNQLVGGMQALQSALVKVKDGTDGLKNGINTLGNGTNQLQNGSQALTDGLGTLSSASGQIKTGLNKLSTGTESAYTGSIELKDGLQTLKEGVGEGIDNANQELVKLNGLSDFVKDSVEIEEVDYGEVTAYGTAFTPLFISVALWVGALMAYVVLYYDQEKRFKLFGKYAENKFLQCGLYLGLAVIQGVVTAFLLDLGLDLNIQNYVLYYGSSILIAVAFMSIIQCLILNLGEAGKLVALILLILQLASSGGTFPIELIDDGFQKISSFMPMTYTIKLIKESVIKKEGDFAGRNIKVIIGYTVVCLGITAIVELIRRLKLKRKAKKVEKVKE